MKLALALAFLPFAANAAVCGFSYCPDSGSSGSSSGSVSGTINTGTTGQVAVYTGANAVGGDTGFTYSGGIVSASTVRIGTQGVILTDASLLVSSAPSVTNTAVFNRSGNLTGMTNRVYLAVQTTGNGATSPTNSAYIEVTRQGTGLTDFAIGTNGGSTAGPSERVRVLASGNVGIGLSSPTTSLEVAGTISATQINVQQTGTCTISGTIRYNSVSNTIQFCNGTKFVSLVSGT